MWRELCLHLKLTVKVSGEEWGGERWSEGGEGWKVVRVILLLYRAKVAAATNRECSICSKTEKTFSTSLYTCYYSMIVLFMVCLQHVFVV